ncbi:cytosolic Fe-S cluster assembly factor [Phascolomyces articulosus]|uniref:Cytosolic Fe-S cluster assembly factor n=1 Tax=Phascolomyces articulosus TaxID=60185 RepID=A0AAD5JWP6_9FUNG|nr:cytosolic Fe-S cluster assembly factor [Phascolomyces articulosus]
MAFSSALVLTDLNDYIAPSQACIKPVEIEKSEDQGPTEIKVDREGDYYEISKDGGESKLEKASITLNDCLACSGCVTSAESVLITMQSQEELYEILNTNRLAIEQNDPSQHRTIVISISPQSRASLAAKYNMEPLQVHRRLVYFFKHHLGAHHVFDASFSRDLSLVESAREFVERFRRYMANGGDKIEAALQQQDAEKQQEAEDGKRRPRARRRAAAKNDEGEESSAQQNIPMLASACPGWVCYAEKTHGAVIPHISAAKSPQQMMGSLVKDYLATKTNTSPSAIYHVSVMPCYDKKLEASRPDFFLEQFNTREVDCVLTTGEIEKMFGEQNLQFDQLPEADIDDMFNKTVTNQDMQMAFGTAGSSSGGYLEYILRTAARELFNINDVPADPATTSSNARVIVKTGKNADVREYFLQNDDGRILLRFATAFGFRNIQNIVRKVKSGKCSYHYVEVMACPGGCVNGGGQLPNPNSEEVMSAKDWVNRVESVYQTVPGVAPEENEVLKEIYNEWIGDPLSERAHTLLRTQYHAVTQNLGNPLATKW